MRICSDTLSNMTRLRRDLVSEEEQQAYQRALMLLCGHMNCVIGAQCKEE